MDKRDSSASVFLSGVAIVAISLTVAYAAGYFWSGETMCFSSPERRETVVRMYKYGWQATLFLPAGKIEELVTGKSVAISKRVYGGII